MPCYSVAFIVSSKNHFCALPKTGLVGKRQAVFLHKLNFSCCWSSVEMSWTEHELFFLPLPEMDLKCSG